MAIDTENERRSVVMVLPRPDGNINMADRMQVLGLYSGISPTVWEAFKLRGFEQYSGKPVYITGQIAIG